MTESVSGCWPQDYESLRAAPPRGRLLLDSVLDPILFIERSRGRYTASLGAELHRRQGVTRLVAPSMQCNWVEGDGLICPLPVDAPDLVAKALSGFKAGDLSFSDVISLRAALTEGLRISVDSTVWSPAKVEAQHIEGSTVNGLRATLYEYQAKGVAWMHRAIQQLGGVLLADEMGLGKTVQVIALLLMEPPTNDSPALVVCPTTLIANWVREIQKFGPTLSVVVHRGPGRARLPRHLQQSQVVITTYDTLLNDLVIFKGIEWSWLICDEAQAVKNPESQRRVAIGQLVRRRAIPVTGTPVENHLLDMWSLVDVAVPGLLGDKERFQSVFPDTPESARTLAEITNPIVLRRLVRDVATDLPERIDVEVALELGSSLAAEYEAVREETLQQYLSAGPMVATGQLQLFCAHPSLRTDAMDREGWEDRAYRRASPALATPKLDRTIELLEEAFANRKKVLVFANFNACGELLKIAARKLPPSFWAEINGSTPGRDRQSIVDAFSAHDGPAVLVLNPRAAGAGLNITAATVVIHFTQVWNPALEQQASARAHRRGQTQPVTIYHLFYVNTVEEVMMDRASRRRQLGEEAVPTSAEEEIDLARALSISPVEK